MSQKQNIKKLVDSYIKANNNQEITGPILNRVLNATVDGLSEVYVSASLPDTKVEIGKINVNNTDYPLYGGDVTTSELQEYTEAEIAKETQARIASDQDLAQRIITVQSNLDNETISRMEDVTALHKKVDTEILNRENADNSLSDRIVDINSKIPDEASSTNQLADKDWVTSRNTPLYTSVTYEELKALAKSDQLNPGQWYRITDYKPVYSYSLKDTVLGVELYPFDILVQATSVNNLSREAKAVANDSTRVSVDQWELEYDPSFDTTTALIVYNILGYDSEGNESLNASYGVGSKITIEDTEYWELRKQLQTVYPDTDFVPSTASYQSGSVYYHYERYLVSSDEVPTDTSTFNIVEQETIWDGSTGKSTYTHTLVDPEITKTFNLNGTEEWENHRGYITKLKDATGNIFGFDFYNTQFKIQEVSEDDETYKYFFPEGTLHRYLRPKIFRGSHFSSLTGNEIWGYLFNRPTYSFDDTGVSTFKGFTWTRGYYVEMPGVTYDRPNIFIGLNDIGAYSVTDASDGINNNLFLNSIEFSTFGQNCYHNIWSGNGIVAGPYCYGNAITGAPSGLVLEGYNKVLYTGKLRLSLVQLNANQIFCKDGFHNNFGISAERIDVSESIENCNFGTYARGITVSSGSLYSSTFGNNVENVTAPSGSVNLVTVGQNANNILLQAGDNDQCTSLIEIGTQCSNVTCSAGCDGTSIGANCNTISLGYNCYSSKIGNLCENITFGNSSEKNEIGNSCNTITLGESCKFNVFGMTCNNLTLGNNVFYCVLGAKNMNGSIGNDCSGIIFGPHCGENTVENGCYYNTFGGDCWRNIVKYDSKYNRFGDYCLDNVIENNSSNNSFGQGCAGINLGYKSYNNDFSNYVNNVTTSNQFQHNWIGPKCETLTFGAYAQKNVIGPNCLNLNLGDNIQEWNVGAGCNNINYSVGCLRRVIIAPGISNLTLNIPEGISPTYRSYIQNVEIGPGVEGEHTLNITGTDQVNKLKLATKSDGSVIQYNEDDIVTTISAESTDIQYPSAKCVYDIVGNIEEALAALR